MPVQLLQQKLTQNTGTQDYTGTQIFSPKGGILACTRATTGTPWTVSPTDPAIFSLGFFDGTEEYNFNCRSVRRTLAADNTQTDHRGHADRILSMMDSLAIPGTDFHAANFDSFLANGFRINKTVAQTGATNLPQMAAAVFYGDRQNFKVGKVPYNAAQQTINLGFQPRAMIVCTIIYSEDFDGTVNNQGMVSIGLVAWNNAGTAIVKQASGLWLESIGLPESDITYTDLIDNAVVGLDNNGFGAIEYTADGFIAPADVPPFIYAAWDWPSTSADIIMMDDDATNGVNADIPASTGAFTLDYGTASAVQAGNTEGAHESEFAIGLLNGLDAGNGWGGGSTGSAQSGTWGLAMQTRDAQICLGMACTPGAAIPVSKSSFSAATGTDRAIQLIKGSDLAVGTQCSHTSHDDVAVNLDCTTAMTVGNRALWLSCGRKCHVRCHGKTRDHGLTRYGGAT